MLMEADLNVTYITLDGFELMLSNRYVYFVVMFTVYILILSFNCTIIFLIVFQRSLHEPMYIFIAALLLNSVMFSTVVYPKLLIDLLSERQIISYSACVLQSFMYYTFGGSEFFLLAVMGYDRYVSICKPLQYPVIMQKRTITILLVSAWFIPSFHLGVFKLCVHNLNSELCSFNLKGIFCNGPLYELLCVRSKALFIFIIIVLLNMVLLVVLFILYTYTRIIIILYQSSKEVRRKAAQTCLPHLFVLINYLCLCASDTIALLLETELLNTLNWMVTYQTVIYQPLFNPVIYGLRMKEISKHLKKLLCRVKMT